MEVTEKGCREGADIEPVVRYNEAASSCCEEEENLNSEVLHAVRADDVPGQKAYKNRALPMLKKKPFRKSRTAPALASMHELLSKNPKKPKLASSSSIVWQASFGLVLYLSLGVAVYLFKRKEFSGTSTIALVDALYFCIVTLCTIGYGDITPLSHSAKLFACIFVVVGFGFIDFLLSALVAYVLERQELLLLSAVEGGHHETARNYLVNVQKGRVRIRTKVGLAIGIVCTCVGVGTIVMHQQEQLGWIDSLYLACMSVTTVGYGDSTFQSSQGRIFASIWLLVSTIAVARSFLFLAEAHIDRRHRLIARWVLRRKITVGDLLAADLNNNGFIWYKPNTHNSSGAQLCNEIEYITIGYYSLDDKRSMPH
ncbi:hypothetical protein O6H91_Y145100 [Diphasiastrum complanatum]|nr:hypothetical protein O6H91_Y145100 [Diphasiastrum complanatum]